MSLQVWLPLNKDPNMTPVIASYSKESGVTLTEDTDGWYKVQDTTHGANGRWGIYYNFNVKPNTTYTLYVYSKSTTGVSARVGIQSFAGTNTWPAVRDTNAGAEKLTTYTWTTGATHNVARVYLALTTTATKANDYVFYKEPKVYEHPRSQGILNNEILNTNWSLNDNGKLGKCIKTLGTAPIDTGVSASEWNINETSVSMCGWFKFPFNEIKVRTEQYSFTDVRTTVQGNLLGYNNYAGIALAFNSNNMYQSNGVFSNLYVYSSIRKGSSLIRNSGYTIPFDTWIHLTAVFDRNSKKTYTYVNGLLYSQSSISYDFTDITATQNFFINIGAVDGGNGPGMNIPFYCNDVRLYNHALTEQEVKKIAQGLIVHYPLNNNGLGNENLMPNSIDTLVGSSNYNTGTWRLAGSSQMNRSRVAIPDSPIGASAYGCQSVGKQTGIDASCWGIDSFPRESGVTYTISAWGRIVGGSTTAAMLGFSLYSATSVSYGGEYGEAKSSDTEYYGSGAYDYAGGKLKPDGKWTRIWRTFTSTASSGNIYIGFNTATTGDDVTLQLCGVKLEKGNSATPWCPNVSDTLYAKMGMNNNIVYDISGFNNNGTITGSLSTLSDSVRYKVSTYFSGSSYISREPLHSGVKSFSFWLKCANASTTQQIVFVDFGTKLAFGFYNGYIITSYTASAIIGNKVLIGNSWINDDWNHIVVVKDNNAISTYCNGTLMTASGNDYWSYNIDEYFMIGRRPHGDRQLLGYLSDFRAYATALSASDIAELYSMGREVT